MATKTRVVLDLNTRVKEIHERERYKLSVKQIMKMFDVGKTQVYEILKKKTEILKLWEDCANGKIRRELSSDVNSETIEEWVAKLPSKTEGYEPEHIGNGDETGLFFHELPNNSLCLKGEKCTEENWANIDCFSMWFYVR
jgi:hypothetical protein